MNSLEIILPVRNPIAVFQRTVESLAAQTQRSFSVLISDNFSTSGGDLIAQAVERLRAADIPVRHLRPPVELGRVEHWNWAHGESEADWLKPLFAGDWLEPGYVARLRQSVAANPDCRYVFCNYVLHRDGQPAQTNVSAWTGEFRPAPELWQQVLSWGMQFGPPSAAAYDRTAFTALGGYPTMLPICADCLLFCTLALRHGALGLGEPLCHFNIHSARFSTNLPQRRNDTARESFTYYFMLAYYAWTENIPIPKVKFARLLAREARSRWFPK